MILSISKNQKNNEFAHKSTIAQPVVFYFIIININVLFTLKVKNIKLSLRHECTCASGNSPNAISAKTQLPRKLDTGRYLFRNLSTLSITHTSKQKHFKNNARLKNVMSWIKSYVVWLRNFTIGNFYVAHNQMTHTKHNLKWELCCCLSEFIF